MADEEPLDEQGLKKFSPSKPDPKERSNPAAPGTPWEHEGMGQGPKKKVPPPPPEE
jgi:hypothetical protein